VEVEERIGDVQMTSVALVMVGSLLVAGCFSIPGHPDDPQVPACLEHDVFGIPVESPYVLPYPVGSAYEVFQTYCGPVSHGKDGQMSIDFLMRMGSKIVAARAGIVRHATDHHKDFGRGFNIIYIEHEDGTAAFYAHMQQRSVRVQVGDGVVAGQVIALSGASGTSLEHLHFGVASSWPVRKPDDLPVNFRNCQGALDERGGLQRGVVYRAVPYSEN
jgi:murein DD-endopeptidase MepM/ murein hydrolase activator NlpD